MYTDMPRNPIAIWLKTVFFVASILTAVDVLPNPQIFNGVPYWYADATLWLIGVGCGISLIGIFWPDRLDGGAIEMLGIVITIMGLLMFVYVLFKDLPRTAFGMVIYSGLTVCFGIQWVLIHRYRSSLRPTVERDG